MFSIHFCIYGFLRSRPGGLELCFLNVCPGLFHRGLPWKRVELSVENCQLRIADSIFLVLFTLRHSQISVAIGCNHFVKFYHISWLKRGEDPPRSLFSLAYRALTICYPQATNMARLKLRKSGKGAWDRRETRAG